MYITKVASKYLYTDKFGLRRTGVRETTVGKLFNGDTVTVDNYRNEAGKIMSKTFVIFNDTMQRIINKTRNKDGKFDRFI